MPAGIVNLALALALFNQGPPRANRPAVIVLVLDGLRPDMITEQIMPNLFRLKQEGVWCANAHSVFPTVTRVNSASISTGTVPAAHGIVSNTMFVEGVGETPFDTANYQNLVKLAQISGGHAVAVPTLAETLEKAGISFAALSSGSTGSGFLLNPMAPAGIGTLISGSLEDGRRVAFPDQVDRDLKQRLGSQKAEAGIPSLLWTERVLRDYVIPELHSRVIIDWLTEPDTTQHRFGIGSPQALAVLKTDDEQIGLLQAKLRELGMDSTTDIIVTADHGFAAEPDPVDLNGAIQATGQASEIIAASNGPSVLLYVKDHAPDLIRRLVARLQGTDGVDLLFTAARPPKHGVVECRAGKNLGWVPGTFSLELINECRPARAADIIVTFQWSSAPNEFGFPGAQRIASTDTRQNVLARSGHGGLNPWVIHTPMVLSGPDFRKRAVVEAPAGNFDIAPTVLALEGVRAPDSMSGRVIAEAFEKSTRPDRKPVARTIETHAGAYCASIQLSVTDHRVYVDSGRRCP
ncbi:MAG: alkaline phosphatase family protein [Bryobacteraceae bacterium]|jgi:predicted AlkP superfamily pyrophosphatase or phosphodiesterase